MRRVGWLVVVTCALACGGSATDPGQTQGGGTITSPDGGSTDAGSPPADCAGLVPSSIGGAITFDVPIPGATCAAATMDGQGIAACDARTSTAREWLEFGTNGTRQGTFEGPPQLFAQPSGFIGVYGASPLLVARWDEGGEVHPSGDVSADAVALGPAAGSGVIAVAAASGSVTVHKLDAQANEVSSATFASSALPLAGAEDETGAVLALVSSGGSVSGLWIDLARKSAGQPFAVGSGSSAAVRALLGGGFAVQLDGAWAGTIRSGETALRAAPSWLAGASDVVAVRGGTALAILPKTGSSVAIVSPQGNSCGSVSFPGVSSVAIGLGGAVVGSTGTGGCTKVVWRTALR